MLPKTMPEEINRVLTDQKNVECVTLRALKTAIAKKEAMRSGE